MPTLGKTRLKYQRESLLIAIGVTLGVAASVSWSLLHRRRRLKSQRRHGVTKHASKPRQDLPKRLVIVKGGGSALTVKDQYETAAVDVIDKTAQQVAENLKLHPDLGGYFNRCLSLSSLFDDKLLLWMWGLLGLVFVHGAGSFGHFDARK